MSLPKHRLSESIERKLLSPFHYFGVTDSVDLSQVRWAYGKYDEAEVENLYVFEREVAKKRAGFIIDAIDRYCTDRKSAAISGRVSCIWRKRIWMCSL